MLFRCAGSLSLAVLLSLGFGLAAAGQLQAQSPDGTIQQAPSHQSAEVLGAGDVEATAKARDIVRVSQPWLRINTPGHAATVQALAFSPDSRRLFSAGLDKVVQVWDLKALPASGLLRDIKRTFLRERTIRWQVSRGPRGGLFAIATAPDGTLAMGGYGAMGSTGEILLLNPIDGSLIKALDGHRQTICSLAFSANGELLVSVDTDGECRVWEREAWASRVLIEKDATTYGQASAAIVQRQPLVRPAVVVGNTHIIIPHLTSTRDPRRPEWKLHQVSLADGKVERMLQTSHQGVVTCLALSADGSLLASADLAGALHLQALADNSKGPPLATGKPIKSLAFSSEAKTLAAGTAVDGRGAAELQFWDVNARKLRSSRPVQASVQACAYSADDKYFAFASGPQNEVFVDRLGQPDKTPIALTGGSRRITQVAFAAKPPYERIAFSTARTRGNAERVPELNQSFNPARGQISSEKELAPGDWLPTGWMAGNWRAQPAASGTSLQLYQGNTSRGAVQLDPQTQGFHRCHCWIPSRDGKPFALAVGTNKQNMIFVYRIVERGNCPLLRQFRGHQDEVTSVAVSRDLKLLSSGSADGTIQFWSLSDLQQGLTTGRWGAGFHIVDRKFIVQAISEAGPLYAKGLRAGDTIRTIRWHDGRQEHSVATAEEIQRRLQDLPWLTQVEFDGIGAVGVPRRFQLIPAWQALGSLFISQEREWAFWTPEGYYDASANGHTLFGWQVNRGLNLLPSFYRADQFRRTLERPDVLRQLLVSGSLSSALRSAKQAAVERPDQVLESQIAATPTISILTPSAGDVINNRSVKVRARVTLPGDGKISKTRVFANGVVAREHELISQKADEITGLQEMVYEWEAQLPNETRNLIQVSVLTEAKTTAFERVLVEQPRLPPAAAPRLYIVAIAVNDYHDEGIEDLDYSVADAEAFATALSKEANGLYEVLPPVLLANQSVTRKLCRRAFTELNEKLKDTARPDDLLVIFMAGHGEINPADQAYHFICQDAALDDLFGGAGSIAWNDFQPLADIPCRKVALLDTCHSGAIQGKDRQNNLAARDFQENLLLTLAAAADDEASQERTDWQHGAFTKTLLDGLAGRADMSRDGVIMLDELVDYTHRVVPELTDNIQHPTAAPQELLEFIALPLAQRSAEVSEVPATTSTRNN